MSYKGINGKQINLDPFIWEIIIEHLYARKQDSAKRIAVMIKKQLLKKSDKPAIIKVSVPCSICQQPIFVSKYSLKSQWGKDQKHSACYIEKIKAKIIFTDI